MRGVPTNPAVSTRRERFEHFLSWSRENIHGDEKGQAQIFLDRLFQALGHGGVFEAGASLETRIKAKDRVGTAFADLTWRPRLLLEMKKRGEDLSKHYQQVFDYWLRLLPGRTDYVILCNFDELWVYDLNRQLEEPIDRLRVEDLPSRWQALAFMLPEPEKPDFNNDLVDLTRKSAEQVSEVFKSMLARGIPRSTAQRAALQSVMAMFAEDVGLLPQKSFTRALEDSLAGGSSYDLVFGQFDAMNKSGVTAGGRYEGTPYFNGGLFSAIEPVRLTEQELVDLREASRADWGQVRPAIFGTLFEKSMEASERRAHGAHFTSETDIQKVVRPTIVYPWRERIAAATTLAELAAVENDMLQFRVLDPACGAGNFLYIAYRELRRLERALQEKIVARRRSERSGDQQRLSYVSTSQFYGIDSNGFAVELAKVTLMLGRKLAAEELGDERSVLPLDNLDANFIAGDALKVEWPQFDACIGNPPYLGRRWIARRLGANYASWLLETYPEVGGASDYVAYWFRKAHDGLPEGGRAGLVGTTTIRQGATRKATLDYVAEGGGVIYDAVQEQKWSGDASLRVSIVNWAKGIDPSPKSLWVDEGTQRVELVRIPGSLSVDLDLGHAAKLRINSRRPKRCFQGQTPGVDGFYLTPASAYSIVASDERSRVVIHPYLIGNELNLAGKPAEFVIDIPDADSVAASQYRGAYDHLKLTVLPERKAAAGRQALENEEVRQERPDAKLNTHHENFLNTWWKHDWRRKDMLDELDQLDRYIALSRVAVRVRAPVYFFVSSEIRPGDRLQVFAFEDDYSFGILHSRYHGAWFWGTGSNQGKGKGKVYSPPNTWQTFPWPQSPTSIVQ